MTFLPEYGADKSISSLSNFPTHHDGFITIPCMSDLWNKKYKIFSIIIKVKPL